MFLEHAEARRYLLRALRGFSVLEEAINVLLQDRKKTNDAQQMIAHLIQLAPELVPFGIFVIAVRFRCAHVAVGR